MDLSNKASRGNAASCELHHNHRKIQRSTLWNPYGLTTVDDEEQEPDNGNDDNAIDGRGGSPRSDSGLFVTPDHGAGDGSDRRERHNSPLNAGDSAGPAASRALGGYASSTYATPESGGAQSAGQGQHGKASSRRLKDEPSS